MIKNVRPLLLGCLLAISGCSGSSSGANSGSSNNNQNAGALAIVVLPDAVVGEYTGTLLWGNTPNVAQNVKATVVRDRKLVSINFSGPGVDASVPSIQNFQFAVTPGSQVGLYHSVKVDQSQEGVAIATHMTNMNIVDLHVGGVKLDYTGLK